ncbi:hypothetical protein B0H15DRAFT_947591 [Mycena belliarum]|uniref:F-box domain-containing protein n=1 Tax=Mycena belliarum TaxID=1033014 RepID=A0AAD6UCP4_9AGAR|nr:hypothetical protein B0H15DRAFT_947591 [Mycena belliae]
MAIHKSAFKRASLPQLPPELWIDIHRLATESLSPLAAVYDKRSSNSDDPLNDLDLQRYLRAVRTLARVCRLWNSITRDLLYAHVRINARFNSLATALADPSTAAAVRSVRLSSTRFDYNVAVLRLCPHLALIVQPEFPRPGRVHFGPVVPLPALPHLTHLYWISSAWSADLLARVLHAAPTLTDLHLSHSSTIAPPDASDVPALPALRDLVLEPRLPHPAMLSLLASPLPVLAHFTLSPAHLTYPAFPTLPTVHTLTLADPSPQLHPLQLARIATRFPRLRELRYNVTMAAPLVQTPAAEAEVPPLLATVRLALASLVRMPPHNVTHLARLARAHLRLLLALHGVERVVLEGRWDVLRAASADDLEALLGELRGRGCVVEGSGFEAET